MARCREQSEEEEENVQGFLFKEEEERSKGVGFTFRGILGVFLCNYYIFT